MDYCRAHKFFTRQAVIWVTLTKKSPEISWRPDYHILTWNVFCTAFRSDMKLCIVLFDLRRWIVVLSIIARIECRWLRDLRLWRFVSSIWRDLHKIARALQWSWPMGFERRLGVNTERGVEFLWSISSKNFPGIVLAFILKTKAAWLNRNFWNLEQRTSQFLTNYCMRNRSVLWYLDMERKIFLLILDIGIMCSMIVHSQYPLSNFSRILFSSIFYLKLFHLCAFGSYEKNENENHWKILCF